MTLAFAIPDHPWVDSADGAAVRISMTVARQGEGAGILKRVISEHDAADGEVAVDFETAGGLIGPDLRVGANVAQAISLRANSGICWQGCKLVGGGFQISPTEATNLATRDPNSRQLLRRYWAGGDITQKRNERYVIDTFGLSLEQLRAGYPAAYQHLFDRVYPGRAQNRDKGFRERWWLFGRPRPELRLALARLPRYFATSEVSKHRFFVLLDWPTNLVDGSITALALSDAYCLGVVSAYSHVCWALAAGGRMGVGNDPRYQNGPCFDNFPFPVATPDQQTRIRDLAEQLDTHRKRQQAQHADLTLTGMYNVLEKLKIGEPLNAKEKVIHEHGLVAVLKTLHDQLDRAVLDAYGWNDLAPLLEMVNGNAAPGTSGTPATRDDCKRSLDDTLLERLVALNAERAAEEQRGLVRWLRPEFQIPASGQPQTQPAEQLEIDTVEEVPVAAKTGDRRPWPATLPAQVKAVAEVLTAARVPLADDAIAAYFTGRGPWKKRLPQIIDTLVAVGRVRRRKDGLAVIA